MFTILSYLCYIFAVVDLMSYYLFGLDITGTSLSPYISAFVGLLLGWIGKVRGELSDPAAECD